MRHEFAGPLEIHLTIGETDAHATASLHRWSQLHGWKPIRIVLSRGESVVQPMATRRLHGGLSEALAIGKLATDELMGYGLTVSRVKVEAAPLNSDVPQTDEDASTFPDLYFEHHVKLLLDAETATQAARVAVDHAAHLSRNALRSFDEHRFERFVTQRIWKAGRRTAQLRSDALLNDLRHAQIPVLESELEYAVYDSRPQLDRGWLSE